MSEEGAGAPGAEPLAEGLWTWTARHPEWHPGDFGAEVRSWAARGEDGVLLLLDPQLPDGEGRSAVLATLDAEAADAVRIAIEVSVGYHARSSEELWERYRGGAAPVSVHGHAAVMKRLGERVATDFHEIEAGAELPGGVVPMRIGKPRRQETPLHLRAHSALLFGDAVVGVDGGARVWADGRVDERVERFYREQFNPTLEPLVELGVERLLFTHGPPVLEGGARALAAALAAAPWHHSG